MPEREYKQSFVFAVYPNANGYGFVYMKNARTLLDYGSVRINPVNNSATLNRIKKALDFLKPSIVVVQNPNSKSSRTGPRVRRLIRKIIQYSKSENLPLEKYSRDQIRSVFEQFGATTKYEISQLLITEFTELKTMAPKKRKLWTSEDRYMAIFDALSLALTWYYLNS